MNTAKIVPNLEEGTSFQDAFVFTNLASSKNGARRLILQGGATFNLVVERDPNRRIFESDLLHGQSLIFGRGKNGWAVVTFRRAS